MAIFSMYGFLHCFDSGYMIVKTSQKESDSRGFHLKRFSSSDINVDREWAKKMHVVSK
jgi:hypothetical protein